MRAIVGLLLLCALLPACVDSSEETTTVLVSAAASLTGAFTEMEVVFEEAHPGVELELNIAGTSTLREQILGGAPVDVFASADLSNMDQIVRAGQVAGEARVFATNVLMVAVPAGNPARVSGLADFSRDELLIGLCARGVPCGDFADAAFEQAGVSPIADTREPDVKTLLAKIELGEIDAGITYRSDVSSSGGTVDGIDIPTELNVTAEYSIAVLAAAPNADGGGAFVAFVLSDAGRSILSQHGFDSP